MRTNNTNNRKWSTAAPEGLQAVLVPSEAQPVAAWGDASWQDAVEVYLAQKDVGSRETLKTYRKAITQFFLWTERAGLRISALTVADVVSFKKWLFEVRHCSSLTVSTYISALRGFYEWAEAARLSPNIARTVGTKHDSDHLRMHLTRAQTRRLLEYFETKGPRDYAMVNLMLRCGLRTVEVSRADIRDIAYLEDQRVLYIQGKGRKDKKRWVVLRDAAYEPIKEYLDERGDGAMPAAPLFVGEGKGSRGRRLSTRTIQDICKRGLRAIGLDSHQYSAHSLRHTAGVRIIDNGGSVTDVQEVLGHASVDTSRIYLRSAAAEQRLANPAERFLDNLD